MGLFQKLFGRNKKAATKETMKVEVDGDRADVAPVATAATKTTTPVAKTTAKANNTAKTTTKATTKTTMAKTNTSNAKTTTATKQCAGTTKAGTQCKRAPVGRGKFCATHKN